MRNCCMLCHALSCGIVRCRICHVLDLYELLCHAQACRDIQCPTCYAINIHDLEIENLELDGRESKNPQNDITKYHFGCRWMGGADVYCASPHCHETQILNPQKFDRVTKNSQARTFWDPPSYSKFYTGEEGTKEFPSRNLWEPSSP